MKFIVALVCCATVGVIQIAAAGSATTRSWRYSGNGTVLLAPIKLTRPGRVAWTATGGLFMLIALQHPAATGPNPQLIVSQATHGTGYLPAGRYRFKISGCGSWRLVIRAP